LTLAGLSTITLPNTKNEHAPKSAAFHLLHMQKGLRKHLRSTADEDRDPTSSYSLNLVSHKKEQPNRDYNECRLYANKRLAAEYAKASLHQYHGSAHNNKIGIAHPCFATFIAAFQHANKPILDGIFSGAPWPWNIIHSTGRMFGDVSIQSYNAQADPYFHKDTKQVIIALSITLGTIARWFITSGTKTTNPQLKDHMIEARTLPLDGGCAYITSPALFYHGTWNPAFARPPPNTGWKDTTLAIHFRPLVTAVEFKAIEEDEHGWGTTATAVTTAIKTGTFRLPCLHEVRVGQINTLRTELTVDAVTAPTAKRKTTSSQAATKSKHARK
jgi:hypothetical protein